MSHRHQIAEYSPTWLRGGVAERFMYSIGLCFDLITEKCTQGIKLRFPTVADVSALPFIGRDRLMPQGPTESNDDYRVRLQQSFDAWQLAGGAGDLLRAVLRTLATSPRARIISDRYQTLGTPPWDVLDSKWYTYPEGADLTHEPGRAIVAPGNWDWDSLSPHRGAWSWARCWIVVESVGAEAWCNPAPWNVGDTTMPAVGDRSWSIGLDVPAETIQRIWDQILLRKPAHVRCEGLIISFDATHFDPAQPEGGGINPDGLFGRWSKVIFGQTVPARTIANARYSQRYQ